MKKISSIKLSILIAVAHCVIGNVLAFYDVHEVIEVLFMPYTFIAGMSNFAGWDSLSYALEAVSLIIIFVFVYGIVSLLRSFRGG